MKKTFLVGIVFLGLSLVSISCEKNAEMNYGGSTESIASENIETLDSVNVMTSSLATSSVKDKQFKRSADIKMEVKDVYKTTVEIEKELTPLEGYVMHSKIENRETEKQVFAQNKDSAYEVSKSYYLGEMTLRVPQKYLGTFLYSLGNKYTRLQYRTLEAEDVSLDYIYHDLENKTLNKANKQLNNSLEKGGNLAEKTETIQQIHSNSSEKNYAEIGKMKLNDDVKYSTITLVLYDKEKEVSQTIVNWETYETKYEPSLGYKIGKSLAIGYRILEYMILAIATLWPFIIIVLLVVILYFGFKKRKMVLKQQL